MGVTIRDVAAKAGVSISTASLVLNGKGWVSDKLRKRVLQAVEELNYRPNAMARGLRARESRLLGLVIPDIANPFFPLVVRGVEDAAVQGGYTVILGNTDGKSEEEAKYLGLFTEKRVDGLIFIPSGSSERSISALGLNPVPKVVIDRALTGVDIPTVMTDNVRGAYMGTQHLLANGRSRILFISGPEDVQASRDRRTGYSRALRERGIDEELIVFGDFSFESGRKAMADCLFRLEFDAVLSANDMMALGAMVALSESGIDVPNKAELVGYDNILFSALARPSLTTVEQPAYQMGFEAVQLVLEMISSGKSTCESKLLEPRLIVRDSSPKRYD